MEREGTVTISFVTYGRNNQAEKTALQMVKDLQVRQHSIVHAAFDGSELQINKKWSAPVLDHDHDEPVVD